MAKNVTKKTNRRLKRQIRKTVGGLFMASAILVAAVPVQDVAANPEEPSTKLALQHAGGNAVPANTADVLAADIKDYESSVPSVHESWVEEDEKAIYTTGDGRFQFAYMRPNSTDTNKYAVILGYNGSSGDNSTLTIPESLIAYKKYSDNVSSEGYCLVSKNGGFLYYEDEEQKRDETSKGLLYLVPELKDDAGVSKQVTQYDANLVSTGDDTWTYYNKEQQEVDEDGDGMQDTDPDTGAPLFKTVTVEYAAIPIMETVYSPCYYEQRAIWEGIADEDLYYRIDPNSDEKSNYTKAGTNNAYWKIVADVAYIGKDVIVSDNDGGWEVSDTAPSIGNGVFRNAGNVQNLIIGGNIWGIGDYAFSGCSNLQSVTLGDNLQTIGNGAFANCIRMTDCSVAINARLQAIGKDAFYNCSSLKSFTAPINLQAMGDCCFEKCSRLESIELCGGDGGAVALTYLGDHIFRDCSSLASIEFPINYTEDETELDIDMFDGCSSLQFIKINNADVSFGDWHAPSDYPNCSVGDWEDFIETVPDSFYFEGPATSDIHDTATEQSIAFKYLNQDLYEKIEKEHDAEIDGEDYPDRKSAKVTYQVNSNNELVNFWINKDESGKTYKPDNVTIPETIGPYGISSIGAGSFTDNCDLVKVTIPASVTSIGSDAFKGCHNLRTVIFTDATTIQNIGSNAFKTQEVSCGHKQSELDAADPELTFVGAMMNNAGEDTVPFIYAMNGISNINNANQEKIWITCHSGWPTNLEVQYNYDPISNTGEAMLIGYPKYAMIKDEASAKEWVANLPYVTGENLEDYEKMVLNATRYYQATDEEKKGMTQPTENEMAIVNSSLNVVVPSSVDSIKPGLFSGYVPDTDGKDDSVGGAAWDKVDNINLSGGSDTTSAVSQPDTDIQTIVLNGVKEVEPYTFKNCTSLREAAIIGPTYIDDYAFDGLTDSDGNNDDPDFAPDSGNPETMQLASVTLGTGLTDTGLRPFRGCENLTNITCLDSDFVYDNGVLYRNTGSGLEVVECLESRGKLVGSFTVGPEELANVTSMKAEAFADCDEIGKVDLSTSNISVIPESCFAETDTLNSVVLPDTVKSIESEAFSDSKIRLLTIPGVQSYIAQDAFMTGDWVNQPSDREEDPGNTGQHTIIFECIEGTTADRYAQEYWYINPEYGRVYLEHTVYFWDYPDYPDTTTKEIFYKIKVKDGEDAVPPIDSPSHDGYQFNRWTDYTNISKDTDVYPVFGYNTYAVEFRDWDGTLIGDVQYIEEGKSATPPADPTRDGYTFTGWARDWNNIQQDTVITATYSDNSGDANRHTVIFYDFDGNEHSRQQVNHGEAAVAPKDPVKAGYTFLGWSPSDFTNVQGDMTIVSRFEKTGAGTTGGGGGTGGGGNNQKDDNDDDDDDDDKEAEARKYTVSVSGGSGSGSYKAGDIVAINAYYLGNGQSFDKWTTSTAGVGFANPNASSTTFTMPAANVAITATYKTGGGTTSTGGGSNTGSTGGGSTTYNPGTTVQVTKPGISNTNLAGATVSGSTDNFIVKVTEDQNATNAVVAALQAKYGDISRIKYLPMDISLYDSTGRTKIADTSGISVSLTLPIPDELVQYAGNNKVAVVLNGSLQDVGARFTTVGGVPCMTFTASHFAPYVIYVDTANLTAGTIDATPKTGDPIHPKWFLAIGMACISLILFFKRDKAVMPVKAS